MLPNPLSSRRLSVQRFEHRCAAWPSAGLEIDELAPAHQAEAVAGGLAVFARVEPAHKTKLVELLKQQVAGWLLA